MGEKETDRVKQGAVVFSLKEAVIRGNCSAAQLHHGFLKRMSKQFRTLCVALKKSIFFIIICASQYHQETFCIQCI